MMKIINKIGKSGSHEKTGPGRGSGVGAWNATNDRRAIDYANSVWILRHFTIPVRESFRIGVLPPQNRFSYGIEKGFEENNIRTSNIRATNGTCATKSIQFRFRFHCYCRLSLSRLLPNNFISKTNINGAITAGSRYRLSRFNMCHRKSPFLK